MATPVETPGPPPERLGWVLLVTTLLPGVGLAALATQATWAEQELVVERRAGTARELARAVRAGVLQRVAEPVEALDARLRNLAPADDQAELGVERASLFTEDGEQAFPSPVWSVSLGELLLAPTLRVAARQAAGGEPQRALSALSDLGPAGETTAALNLRAQILWDLERPHQALEAEERLLQAADPRSRVWHLAQLRKVEGLRAVGDPAGAAALAREQLEAWGSSGPQGLTPGEVWTAYGVLARVLEGADAPELATALEVAQQARVAAAFRAWGDPALAPGSEPLSGGLGLAPFLPEGEGWVVYGPLRQLPDGRALRAVCRLPRARLVELVGEVFEERAGPSKADFGVELVGAGSGERADLALAQGDALRVIALSDGQDAQLDRARMQQRVALLAGLLVVVLAGTLFAWRSVRRTAELSRLRADFVASVTHELKTPVASIRAMAEVLALDKVPAERRASYFSGIAAESQRLGRLVEDILDASRIEQGRFVAELEPGQLEPLLEEARASFELGGGEVQLELPEEPLPVCAFDRTLLVRALINLLDNARKYGAPPIVLAARAEGESVVLSVRDQGPGLPNAERGAVFQRFVRGANAQGIPGAGLGLAIVRTILETHGGTLALGAGPGACFELRLPVWREGGQA